MKLEEQVLQLDGHLMQDIEPSGFGAYPALQLGTVNNDPTFATQINSFG